ncbi:MAG TPA: hypothetical protein VFJ16_18835 [Longimicrobium sp.]|nr:hypothetical protein [Longimicrobium sp.]
MPNPNEQFLADPKAFAKKWALYPVQDPNACTVAAGHLKVLDLGNDRDLNQVQGTNKVRYCEIRRPAGMMVTGDFADAYDADLDLYLMQITNVPASATSFPVYYLPWGLDATTRIKLKPSPNHPTRDARGRIIDPDVFVTPAVQGCSIFIDGTAEEPVVYHINATSTGGEVLNAPTRAQALQRAQAKIDDMRDRHATAQRRHPKDPRPRTPSLAPPRYQAEAHMTQYMGEFLTPAGRAELNRRHDTRSVWNLWGLLGGGNTQTLQAGSIFGIRREGKWSFYRQTRTRVTSDVFEPNEAPYGPPVLRRESRWVATQCVQFWPVYRG